MNNSQFRKLILDTPSSQPITAEGKASFVAAGRHDGATTTLGSRMRSSIPMTPRSVAGGGGTDFARQLAERAAGSQSQKKFRSSAAPKGTKLPSGYVDRTKLRVSEEEDDKAARIKSLEEMVKLQQMDQATFEKLRDEILGGDVESTHLVKGLDYKLLERVRRGEDVLSERPGDVESETVTEDVDDEFERLEHEEIVPVVKEKVEKIGQMAPPSLIPGKKRTRDQILAELKASRQAAKQATQPSLGTRFKKFGESRSSSRIEIDSNGREVLITVDENGHEKRKVRKAQVQPEVEKGNGLLMPDKEAKPLGMEVPDNPKSPEEDEEINIFDDAGDDYDPLAGLEEDDSEGELSGIEDQNTASKHFEKETTSMEPPPRPKPPAAQRNYFGESKNDFEEDTKPKALLDPTILAALKKASTLDPFTKAPETEEEAAKEAKRRKMLQQDDRDAQDMDMGFGSSRFEDEEDFEDKKIKLSHWGGNDDADNGRGDGKGKRKRGPKKRKGNVNSAADVLKVLERRKAAES
ncbi:hypothetical protein F5884DRAFT_693532 [Xylogone sp. PMI_703]|nr:hypothetical protein F5884DRAFT_693532 [Xylogone sp. PMI_703]